MSMPSAALSARTLVWLSELRGRLDAERYVAEYTDADTLDRIISAESLRIQHDRRVFLRYESLAYANV